MRPAGGMTVVRDALADLHFAGRCLSRSPGFTAAAVFLLALGIGANTAIFTLTNAVLLRALPVREPGRLVLFTIGRSDGSSYYMIPQSLYRQLRDRNTVLDNFAAATFPPFALSSGGSAERVSGLLVSGTFFETLGVEAIMGRVLTQQDERMPVSPAVCVISYGLWQRRFGQDPGVVGRKVLVNSHPFTIIGVTPKDFLSLSEDYRLDISIPLTAEGMSDFSRFPVRTFGRLKGNVTASEAQASLHVLYHQIAGESRSGATPRARVVLHNGAQGFSRLRAEYEKPLRILVVVVGLVLLIACANVANLLLARSSVRVKEMALRLALGAGPARLARQLLVENTLLAAIGAALGMALAYSLDHFLLSLAPRQSGGEDLGLNVNPDWRVLLFTACVAILVSILCGIVPIINSARVDPGPALKGAPQGRGPGRLSFGRVLVIAQVSASLVLLIVAGLFLRSLNNLQSVDPGLKPDHLVLVTLDPGLSGYSAAASVVYGERLVDRVRRIPGVVDASPGFISPFSGGFGLIAVSVPGNRHRAGEAESLQVNWIGPNYFSVLGTPLLAGRMFAESDGGTNRVAVVNEETARHFWPQESPVGKHAQIGDPAEDYEIVGVVKDVKRESLRKDAEPTVYLPFRQNTRPHLVLHVRVAGQTAPVTRALIREIHDLDPNVPPFDVTTMEAQVSRALMLDRLMASLTSLFGLLAMVLAAAGMYGVIAYSVAGRTREIGIRMALGADYSRLVWHVMRDGLILALIGIAIGIPGALWGSQLAAKFLYGLSADDAATYVLLAMFLAGIAVSAAWIPARRAARVDPLIALRHD